MIFGQKYKGESRKGVLKVDLAHLSTFKKEGTGKDSGTFGNYGDILDKYCGIWVKYGGILEEILWYLVKNTKGGGEMVVYKLDIEQLS